MRSRRALKLRLGTALLTMFGGMQTAPRHSRAMHVRVYDVSQQHTASTQVGVRQSGRVEGDEWHRMNSTSQHAAPVKSGKIRRDSFPHVEASRKALRERARLEASRRVECVRGTLRGAEPPGSEAHAPCRMEQEESESSREREADVTIKERHGGFKNTMSGLS